MEITIQREVLRIPILIVLVLVFLMAGRAVHCLATALTTITILARAEVNGPEILLGDIARFQGDDAEQIGILQRVVIGKAPLPGHARVLEPSYIQLRLKQNGFNLDDLSVQSPPNIEISRGVVEVDASEMKEIVTNFITPHALRGRAAARIKSMQVPESIILPQGQITYQVLPPRNTTYLGHIPLIIHFSVDGQLYKKIAAAVTVEMMVDVVVTKRPLPKHTPISDDDVELRKMDVADLPSDVLTDLHVAVGQRTRESITSQTVLRTDLIEMAPIVNRGDIVVIVVESEGFRITALGKAKRKGRLGERIPIENVDSKKILHAQVVDSRTVKIEF